jgi:hypothetical protein
MSETSNLEKALKKKYDATLPHAADLLDNHEWYSHFSALCEDILFNGNNAHPESIFDDLEISPALARDLLLRPKALEKEGIGRHFIQSPITAVKGGAKPVLPHI